LDLLLEFNAGVCGLGAVGRPDAGGKHAKKKNVDAVRIANLKLDAASVTKRTVILANR
jgi:hypothetical protein